MDRSLRTYGCWAVALILLSASASFAQGTATITLTGVGNATTLGNVYVDPYTATVNLGSGAVSTAVICDDWADDTYVGESWTTNIGAIGATNVSGTPLFGDNPTLYNELAWLATQLAALPTSNATSAQKTLQTELSFAIWELSYDKNGKTAAVDPTTYLNTYAPGDASEVSTLLGQAECAVLGTSSGVNGCAGNGGFVGSGWEILTPVTGTSGPPQEFLVDPPAPAPEPAVAMLFGVGLAGLLGWALVNRRNLRLTN